MKYSKPYFWTRYSKTFKTKTFEMFDTTGVMTNWHAQDKKVYRLSLPMLNASMVCNCISDLKWVPTVNKANMSVYMPTVYSDGSFIQ